MLVVAVLAEAFVDFTLDQIETSRNPRIAEVCLELILSFNQHFTDMSSNMVMRRLSERKEATILTQQFLKMFNEGGRAVFFTLSAHCQTHTHADLNTYT